MTDKPKKGKIDLGKLVRRIARERIGQPGTEKVVPDQRRKKLDKSRKNDEEDQ